MLRGSPSSHLPGTKVRQPTLVAFGFSDFLWVGKPQDQGLGGLLKRFRLFAAETISRIVKRSYRWRCVAVLYTLVQLGANQHGARLFREIAYKLQAGIVAERFSESLHGFLAGSRRSGSADKPRIQNG